MILDDRPVIEQLLNPTPLNALEEVQSEMHKWLQALALHPAAHGRSNEWLAGAEEMLSEFAYRLEARL